MDGNGTAPICTRISVFMSRRGSAANRRRWTSPYLENSTTKKKCRSRIDTHTHTHTHRPSLRWRNILQFELGVRPRLGFWFRFCCCCCCCCCCCFGRSDRSADRFVGPRSNWDEVLVGAELFDGWSCRPTKKLIFPSTDLPFSLHTSHLAMTG